MTDYVITNGRSSAYPLNHYGGHIIDNRATFCETADFVRLDSNVLAIPNLPVTVLSASPVSVGEEFFGMHVGQKATGSVSGLTFKTVRSHDIAGGKGRWQFIQPTASTWDWADLDSWVDTHHAAGRDLIFTLFGTPGWASARPTEDIVGKKNAYSSFIGGVWYSRGIAAEPADMTKWDAFCTAVVTRYLGKIKYYEIWNEPNYNNDGVGTTGTSYFFSGTFAKLSEMVRRASQAIKAVDSTAKIICPPVQGWTTSSGAPDSYFAGMMVASDGASGAMKDWVDIIGVHLYLPGPNKIQDLAGMIDRINAAKTTAGVSALQTWDTESAPIGPNMIALTDDKGKQLIARMLLTMAAKGIARTIYYQYDSGTMGFINRPQIAAYREQIVSLLRSGIILTLSRFTDGRVGYYTNSGLTII